MEAPPLGDGPVRRAFPVITGFRRSGTTLVALMLDAHPELCFPPESGWLAELAPVRERYEAAGAFAAGRFLDDLIGHRNFAFWRLAEADVRQAVESARPAGFADAVRAVFGLFAERDGSPGFGEKSVRPGLVASLSGLFPEARFIHVIRDGRDSVPASMEAFGGTVASTIGGWGRIVTATRRDGREVGPERYHEIRYDDLLDDPAGIMAGTCAFLGIAFDERMLRYHEAPERVMTRFGHVEYHHNNLLPPTKGLRDWRTRMPRRDVELCQVIAGPVFRELGFAPAPYRSRPAAYARAGIWRTQQGVQVVRSTVRVRTRIRDLRGRPA